MITDTDETTEDLLEGVFSTTPTRDNINLGKGKVIPGLN
jgi:hypothetical protein